MSNNIPIKNLPGLKVTTLENDDSKLQRLGVLNESYRKRYSTYTKIAAMVVVFLVGFIVIQLVEPMIPGVISNILMIALVLFVGYYMYVYFVELNSRSTLNYDELELPTKNPGETDKPAYLGDNEGDLSRDFGMCMEDSCCNAGTKFSTTLHKCVPDCSGNVPMYDIKNKICIARGPATTGNGYINTEAFTLGNESYQTSGEKYVDKSRVSLSISAVGIPDSGLMSSNSGIDKYSSV